MKKTILVILLSCAAALPALAQTMPPPHAAPRTPVNREDVAERGRTPPREVSGKALILDGDKLRIADVDLRLFGVVPPQLSANFGPQARAALDAAMGGQDVTCRIRDRDHDGRLLATCTTSNGIDPALNLLQRGLAVAARGSIADTELAQPYNAAELAAQNAKIGLWSVTIAAPAVSFTAAEPTKPEAKVEAKVETPKPEPVPVAAKPPESQAKISSPVMTPTKLPVNAAAVEEPQKTTESPGLFARYQILIAGFLMLATALSIFGCFAIARRMEKRDEMRALAAALRGELLAARAVCQTRIKSIVTEEDDRAAAWPRIRSTLYQAYVARLGSLGAELARQVASIYGQASDYASYYNNFGEDEAAAGTPKRQALQSLAAHIEEILPRLAGIEQTGERYASNVYPVSTLHMPPVPEHRPPPMARLAKPVVTTPEVVTDAAEETATSTAVVTVEQGIEGRLRNAVRNLRERFVEPQETVSAVDEPLGDYTALIEQDIERFSFGIDDDDSEAPSLSKLSRN